MRIGIVACIGLLGLGLAGQAAAADLRPPRYQAPVARGPVYNGLYDWKGFYLGINGGGGWGRSHWDGITTFDVSGGLIGGTVGYNWQVGPTVIGVEGDIAWSGIEGSTTIFCPPGCETRNHWLATGRGRLGYAFDRLFFSSSVLPYVTAGLALGDIQTTVPGFPVGSVTSAGWTVGAGVEFGIVPRVVSVKAEYLYVDLGDYNCGFNCGLAANGNVSFYANVFRGGVNIRFGNGN
jgi:outer membrane immunogenic protein